MFASLGESSESYEINQLKQDLTQLESVIAAPEVIQDEVNSVIFRLSVVIDRSIAKLIDWLLNHTT